MLVESYRQVWIVLSFGNRRFTAKDNGSTIESKDIWKDGTNGVQGCCSVGMRVQPHDGCKMAVSISGLAYHLDYPSRQLARTLAPQPFDTDFKISTSIPDRFDLIVTEYP